MLQEQTFEATVGFGPAEVGARRAGCGQQRKYACTSQFVYIMTMRQVKPALIGGFVALALVGCGTQATQSVRATAAGVEPQSSTRLCDELPTLPNPGAGKCKEVPVLYRDQDGTHATSLSSIPAGVRAYGDGIGGVPLYFLRLPDGAIAPLGEFHLTSNRGPSTIYDQLGFRMMQYTDAFFDVVIVGSTDGFCIAYKMRAPFSGEVVDCAGRGDAGVAGVASYMPGTISVKDAERQVVALVAADSVPGGRRAEVLSSDLHRGPDGSLHYLVKTRRWIRNHPSTRREVGLTSVPATVERRTYKVALTGGGLSLVEQGDFFCDGRTCVPQMDRNPGGRTP
ncbi:hypothetical protein [Variovorax guangxiensis]|uniref:hypothetical protein n=1 Tax=Variovorax guangxiensis TaxID=1775474 RepID=UPI00285BD3FA|nr:hypothetical protein [Variovorax guangxiensis]MDR6860945.1 hypothetical protein [Variovorax guangxiensis]